MSLKLRFILYFGLGTVFFIFLITVLVFNRIESTMEDQLLAQFTIDGENRIERFDSEFSEITRDFKISTSLPMFSSIRFHTLTLNKEGYKNDIRQLELYFYDLIKKSSEINQVRYITQQGREAFLVQRDGISSNLRDFSTDSTVVSLLKMKRNEVIIELEKVKGELKNIVWWMPVYVSSDTRQGVISYSMDYEFLNKKVNSLVYSKDEGACLLENNMVLVNTSKDKNCGKFQNNMWEINQEVSFADRKWVLRLFVDSNSFLNEVKDLKVFVFGVIFPIVAIMALFFTLSFSNQISSAISKLVEVAKALGKEEELPDFSLNRDDELGELEKEMKRSAKLISLSQKKLKLKNSDLEAYSYTLAHDLRSPLRSITSFSQIIEMECKDKLNEEELGFIDKIVKASKRMAHLIDDILELSRISNREINVQDVSLTQMAESIIERFEETSNKRSSSIIIEKDMDVKGDPQLLRLILENLLGNAWKYSGRKEHCEIEFGVENLENSRVYSIRDNGVGFDMQYANKLFKPFQRLHSNEEFEGTGIGLASVKRMLLRHHGRVWVTSMVDIGTTVYFTLWDSSLDDKEINEDKETL